VIPIWPVAHFFWGYSITLVVSIVILWSIKKDNVKVKDTGSFIKKRALLGIFGGIWAMIPDIDYFLEDYIFSNNQFSDIFFLHISLDKVLPETDLFFAAEMLLVFSIINLFALAVTVESFKRLNEALFGRKPEDDDDEDEDEEMEQNTLDDEGDEVENDMKEDSVKEIEAISETNQG
jgi:hypothetical protein